MVGGPSKAGSVVAGETTGRVRSRLPFSEPQRAGGAARCRKRAGVTICRNGERDRIFRRRGNAREPEPGRFGRFSEGGKAARGDREDSGVVGQENRKSETAC